MVEKWMLKVILKWSQKAVEKMVKKASLIVENSYINVNRMLVEIWTFKVLLLWCQKDMRNMLLATGRKTLLKMTKKNMTEFFFYCDEHYYYSVNIFVIILLLSSLLLWTEEPGGLKSLRSQRLGHNSGPKHTAWLFTDHHYSAMNLDLKLKIFLRKVMKAV